VNRSIFYALKVRVAVDVVWVELSTRRPGPRAVEITTPAHLVTKNPHTSILKYIWFWAESGLELDLASHKGFSLLVIEKR
jgi:hypothetical protein